MCSFRVEPGTRSAPYKVLGTYLHSQYNMQDENKCDGPFDTQREVSQSTSQCNVATPAGRDGHPGFRFIFAEEVWENGRGYSTHSAIWVTSKRFVWPDRGDPCLCH